MRAKGHLLFACGNGESIFRGESHKTCDWLSGRSVKDSFQVSDLSDWAENGGWAMLGAGELEGTGRLGGSPPPWRCWLHHSKRKRVFRLGGRRQGTHPQYLILVEPDPQMCCKLPLAGSPTGERPSPSFSVFCHPRWMSRQPTFLSHSANSNSILI